MVATDVTEPARAARIGGEKHADLWASCLFVGEEQGAVQQRLLERYQADRRAYPDLRQLEAIQERTNQVMRKRGGWNVLGPTIRFHVGGGMKRTTGPDVVFPSSPETTWKELIASVETQCREHDDRAPPEPEDPDWTPNMVRVLNAVIAVTGHTDAIYPIGAGETEAQLEEVPDGPTIAALQRVDPYCSPIMEYLDLRQIGMAGKA